MILHHHHDSKRQYNAVAHFCAGLCGGGGEGITEHHHLHHDVLLGKGLYGADVDAGVGHVDVVDNEDPVVGRLMEDGVSLISTECEVANSEKVQ